jgi:hypothetical protein
MGFHLFFSILFLSKLSGSVKDGMACLAQDDQIPGVFLTVFDNANGALQPIDRLLLPLVIL